MDPALTNQVIEGLKRHLHFSMSLVLLVILSDHSRRLPIHVFIRPIGSGVDLHLLTSYREGYTPKGCIRIEPCTSGEFLTQTLILYSSVLPMEDSGEGEGGKVVSHCISHRWPLLARHNNNEFIHNLL